MQYLGHVVSSEGVATEPNKTSAVEDWPTPTITKQVLSFLGFVGYYRRFILGFSKVAAPLHALLRGTKGQGSMPIKWFPECQEAFDKLKRALISAPVLAYADFTKPFRVYVDASLEGLGAVLSQEQNNKERVIAYASRSLSPTERNDQNYSSFKLELLGLKWAATEKFKDYLWGATFTVYTDNNPLVHLDTAKLGATEQRWVAQLANYTFDIKYRPGSNNQNGVEDRLRLVDGTLIRRIQAPDTGLWCEQLVITNTHSETVLREYHQALGHAGKEKVLSVLRRRFYWPNMTTEVKNWTEVCPTCIVSKPGPEIRAPLQSIKTSYPFEVVGLDYLSLGRPADPFPYILVIYDLFSRYALAVPTRDQTAVTTVKALTSTLFQSFGCPERILTDQGAAFESSLMHQLYEMYGCAKSRTTPYHPQGNGSCERFNQTLLRLLGSLEEGTRHQWHLKLPALVHAYNNSVHRGDTPLCGVWETCPSSSGLHAWCMSSSTQGRTGGLGRSASPHPAGSL